MSLPDFIPDDEIILRRLRDGPDQTKNRPNHGWTATSFGIRPRNSEQFPSWSRQRIVSPTQLLQTEFEKGRDISGWSICAVSVKEIRSLGLDVVAAPTAEDPGHCHIVPTDAQSFTNKIWSKLAKRTRVIHVHPVGNDL